MKQKKIEQLEHNINTDTILKCLWAIRDRDQFYFNAYGKEMLDNLVQQRVIKLTELQTKVETLERYTGKKLDRLIQDAY